MHQIDSYLSMGSFKDKIREINGDEIQRISYDRVEISGKKESEYDIQNISLEEKKELLNSNKILCTVDKMRRLWIYENTRIHLDTVAGLGYFLELETVIKDISPEKGLKEFKKVMKLLKIDTKMAVAYSYSDLILDKQNSGVSFVLSNKFASV